MKVKRGKIENLLTIFFCLAVSLKNCLRFNVLFLGFLVFDFLFARLCVAEDCGSLLRFSERIDRILYSARSQLQLGSPSVPFWWVEKIKGKSVDDTENLRGLSHVNSTCYTFLAIVCIEFAIILDFSIIFLAIICYNIFRIC